MSLAIFPSLHWPVKWDFAVVLKICAFSKEIEINNSGDSWSKIK